MVFIYIIKLHFSFQCHMILQKSFLYADLVLNKTFIIIIVVLLNIFVETIIQFFQNSVMNRKFKRTAFVWSNIINVSSVPLVLIPFKKQYYWPQT